MKKFIKILKNINLSKQEKAVLRYKIEEFISFNPIRNEIHVPKKSFYFSIFTFRNLAKGVSLVLIALIVVGGSGVSYASNDALPGDRLYTVKINVNEKIEEKLAIKTETKVAVQTQKIERRLTEAQKLVERKDLSPEKKEIVRVNLERNVSDVARTIENLKNEGKIEKALDTAARITPVLEAHKKVLTEQRQEESNANLASMETETPVMMATFTSTTSTEISQTTETPSTTDTLLEVVAAAIQKVEEVENKVIEKVNEDQKKSEEITNKTTEEVLRKLETIKKENEITEEKQQLNEAQKTQTEISTEKTPDEISTKPEILIESKKIQVQDISTASSVRSIAEETKIASQTDVEIKIKEAETLIKQAEEARSLGNFREAFRFSQTARKIIQQIEEYRKIKNAETQNEVKIEKTQNASSTPLINTRDVKTINPEVKPSLDTKTEGSINIEVKPEIINPIDIKAEAIRSIEEANASLKKLDTNQSTQIRLLP